MQRIGLLLLGMASLVASGVIMDRGRVGLSHAVSGLGLQTVQGIRGGIMGDSLSHDELVRQKLILEILHQVHMPLQQQDLIMLDDPSTITNENLYMRPLTQEMHMVLDMIRNNQLLDKQTVWYIHNDQHVRQMIGLYRLMVTARDFDTLMRLIVHARQNVNTEMFVNCLVLALGERDDTQMLIVPALHEILPQLFHEDRVIDQVRNLDTGVSSIRPQLMDVVGTTRQQRLLNSRIPQQQGGGLWDVLNRSQMWMPWRELHKQLGWRKIVGGNVQQQQEMATDKLVITLPGNGLLTEDIGLKTYVNILIDELIVNQDKIRNTNRNQMGMRGINQDVNGRGIWGQRGQMDMDDIRGGLRKNRDDDDDDMMMINSQRRNNLGLRQGGMIDSMRNRMINRGGRMDMDNDMDMDRNRVLMGGRRRMDNVLTRNDDDEDDMMSMSGRRLRNRLDIDNERIMTRGGQIRGRDLSEEQRGINTVSVNDARLLFVGRRRKNPNNVVNLNGRNTNDDDDVISGGRRVSKEGKNDKNERQRMWQDNDDDDDIKRMNKNNRRGGMMWNNENDDDDYLMWNMNRRRLNGMNVNSRDSWQNRQIDLDDEDILQRQGMGMTMGRGRDDFLNIVNRNRMGQRQLWGNDEDVMMHHRSLDMDLPTTNIDNERLLYVNRRRLNNVDDGRRVNNRLVDIDEDEDDDDVLQQRRNMGIQRGNRNMDWTRLDEQNNWQRNNMNINNRRVQQDQREQNWGRLGVDSSTGRRYRRSLDSQNIDIINDNTITGKLLLHTLQQLVARLNIERISLGLPQLMENLQNNRIQGVRSMGSRLDVTSRRSRLNDLGNVEVDVQTLQKIEILLQRIDQVLEQNVGDISIMQHDEQINEIGLILAGQIQEVGLIDLLREVLQRPQQKGQIANIIENEAVQMLLAGIVKVVDRKVQQVFRKREEFISTVRGVTINNVEVDRLQTQMEMVDVDLSNLLRTNMDEIVHGHQKEVIGRMPRLNHKNFNIQVDVTSDRQQQVVVRNLLVPKVDGQGKTVPLQEKRQNVIVMDITTVELQPGRNTLNLRSNDITLTARDTTPLTEIYQQVMQALKSGITLQKELLVGQTNMLPHRLLLPRGRVNGLPMQLITVITPVETISGGINQRLNNGLDILLLDRLPLNYPLHCDLTDLDRVVSMPNLMVKDVKIYHDDQIRMNLMY